MNYGHVRRKKKRVPDPPVVDVDEPIIENFNPFFDVQDRGEKLYVTKDKRRPTSWRRCLSWIVACTVITVVLIVAILAGTGVILSQEPNLVKEASVGRNFAGSNLKPSVTQKTPVSPTDMTHIYVPRSIESELIIDNLDFDPALENVNSSAYQNFANAMEDQLRMILFDKETLEFGASDIGLRVVNISRDPFKVNYRIGWNYKQGVNNPPEPIKMEDVKRRLVESLARNQGYIDKYHIDREAIKVNHVTNTCQMDNGGCSHICYYNYKTQQFTCTCPTHLVLDNSNKNCVAWTGFSEDDVAPIPNHTIYPSEHYETTSYPGNGKGLSRDYEHQLHQGVHHQLEHQYEAGASPEPGLKGHPNDEHEFAPEPTAEPAPEPTPEPDSNGKYGSHLDLEAKPEPTPEPTADGENASHLGSDDKEKVEDRDHYHHHHVVHSGHEPAAEPTAEPSADGKYHESAPEPTADPGSTFKGDSVSGHGVHSNHDSAAEPTAEPAPEPTAEPDSTFKDGHSMSEHGVHSNHDSAAEPTAEPAPEPTAEPGSTFKGGHSTSGHGQYSGHDSEDHEPAPEPTAEPDSTFKDGHSVSGHSVHSSHDSAAEPTAEPAPEPTAEPDSTFKEGYSKSGHGVYSGHEFKEREPAPEPTAELSDKDHESSAEPTPEPTADGKYNKPTAEPGSTFKEGHSTSGHGVYSGHDSEDHEPAPEPTAEPSPDSKEHESLPEPTPEPSTEDDTKSVSHKDSGIESHSSSGVQEHFETTQHPIMSSEHQHLNSNSSDGRDSSHSTSQERAEVNDAVSRQTERPDLGAPATARYDRDEENKSTSEPAVHHVPYLEDILIKDSSLHPIERHHSNENSTSDHGLLGSVEVTAKGEPVIEEIVINKSKPSGQSDLHPDRAVTQGTHGNAPDHDSVSKPVILEGSSEPSGHPQESSTEESSSMSENRESDMSKPVKTENSESTEDVTAHPKIVEYNLGKGVSFGVTENSEATRTGSEHLGNERNYEANKSTQKDFDPKSNLSGHSVAGDVVQAGPEATTMNPHSEIHPSGGILPAVTEPSLASPDIASATTGHPETHSESFTIPVSVFSDAAPGAETAQGENSPNSKNNQKVELPSDAIPLDDSGKDESTMKVNQNETPGEVVENQKDDVHANKSFGGDGKGYETTIQPQVGVTTPFSDHSALPPKVTEKNLSSGDEKEVGTDSKKSGAEPNGTVEHVHHGEAEGKDTKSPEELSNNIKDEGLENDEFNTLLDNEYKNKEGHSNESKEVLINKYPSKPLKGDKKKLKDFAKGDKIDTDKKVPEGTVRPPVTTKDYILQKHVSGNDNTFYPDYSLQNEHTTKHDGDLSVAGPHEVDGVPGVSLKPHGIDNHDISVLQTVAPDFRTETVFPGDTHESETYKPDSKTKPIDTKEGDSKSEKEYPKFDKDYKYDKQKGSKKKDLKKKVSGKDGKNVELEDGRKLYTEFGEKDDFGKDFETAHEVVKDIPETTMNPSFESVQSVNAESGTRMTSESSSEENRAEGVKGEGPREWLPTTIQPTRFSDRQETKTEPNTEQTTVTPAGGVITNFGGVSGSVRIGEGTSPDPRNSGTANEQAGAVHTDRPDLSTLVVGGVSGTSSMKDVDVDQNGHLMIDEPSVKNNDGATPGTVYDGHVPGTDGDVGHSQSFTHSTTLGNGGPDDIRSGGDSSTATRVETSGTVFDGTTRGSTFGSVSGTKYEVREPTGGIGQNISFSYKTTDSLPGHVADGNSVLKSGIGFSNSSTVYVSGNSTTAHPTIIVHGQSGNLQDGHTIRFVNSTFHTLGDATPTPSGSIHNGTVSNPDGHSFTFTNFTTFPNGTAVHPTIVVRGQSGALQDGHEVRFGNSTFHTFVTPAGGVFYGNQTGGGVFGQNSTVYRIENDSLPGTVFDGHFNPTEGHYHMFTNSSGTFVFTNSTPSPSFVIKGKSGDFGNSTVYILGNATKGGFSESFSVPQRTQTVIFRNSTVFAVGNATGNGGVSTVEIQEVTMQPGVTASNETIRYTHQLNPTTFLSGTAYKVNNYFGYVSKCAAGQFQCVNGTSKRGSACISLSSKCDSINDCSDGSDELGCIENGCPGNFQCSDGTCLKRNLVCNGIVDCRDGSDEKQCESWKCEFDEFRCPSGRCIPIVWQCDGKPDCDNHTDEYHCQTSCGNDEYLCPEGWCIPLTYKCNGIKECSNGEDEQLCDCSHDEFKCQTGGCISKSQICNGLDECPDRSDEWGCVQIEPDTSLLKIRTVSGDFEPVCADNWSSQHADELCASLGYYSSAPLESGNTSSVTTETSLFFLKNDTTADFNKKFLVNLRRGGEKCSSGKLVEVSCQEFSCGSRSMTDSSSVEARFIGGMSATAGQWPSVALLYNIRNFHSCTANVLTPRWVLASYNCLKSGNKNLNEQDWKLFGGSTVFEAEKENAETRKIVSIVPHPQVKFNQFLFSNDLALVELDQPLHFTSNIGAVCLPEQEIQPRQICVTAGWGMNTPEDKFIKQQLQYLPVPTMNLTECNSTEHYSGFITEDKICAGFNTANKSLCYNEEGAPLMCVNDRGEWELQGVLSYHSNCGRGSHPSIFSSITPVRDWIKKTIGNTFERKIIAATKR